MAASGHSRFRADPRKAIVSGKRFSRVGDGDLVAGERCHGGQWLGDVHRTDQDHAKWRIERLVEYLGPGLLVRRDTNVDPQSTLYIGALSVCLTIAPIQQPLFA